MKRIFALALTVCLTACASQPPKAVTADQPIAKSSPAAVAAVADPARSSHTVYLDDLDLIHVQAPPSNRRPLVLGAQGKGGE